MVDDRIFRYVATKSLRANDLLGSSQIIRIIEAVIEAQNHPELVSNMLDKSVSR